MLIAAHQRPLAESGAFGLAIILAEETNKDESYGERCLLFV